MAKPAISILMTGFANLSSAQSANDLWM